MQLDQFVLDALDHVLSWDIPDDACSQAISSEAAHLAGLDFDRLEAFD